MALPEGFAAIDFADYHTRQLPDLGCGARGRAAAQVAADFPSLALQLPSGEAYTYIPRPRAIEVVAGADEADTIVELSLESWQGLVHDIEAPPGLLYAGRLTSRRGRAAALLQWETPLRVLYQGRTPYDPAQLHLFDRSERPLDPERSFTLADDPGDMAHFLAVAGYLLVRGVFSRDEVERFRAESAQLVAEARPGDKLSWWGKDANGAPIVCRVTRAASKPGLGSLCQDARLQALADLADGPLEYRRGEGDGVAVIFKHPGVREGLGDLPWHRDCGLGGHAILCPTAVASVFLAKGTPESGELCFLPGSRHAAFNPHDPQCRGELPVAHFAAEPGDVTFHFGDTIHAAPPPQPGCAEYRSSAIVGFARPDGYIHRHQHSYNESLHGRADGVVDRPKG